METKIELEYRRRHDYRNNTPFITGIWELAGALFCLIVAVTILIVGVAKNVSSDVAYILFGAAAFFGIGMAVLIILGVLELTEGIKTVKNYRYLLKNGDLVLAKITRVNRKNDALNNDNPEDDYEIMFANFDCVGVKNKKEYSSPFFIDNPNVVPGLFVRVMVDKKNENNYYVDLDTIVAITEDKKHKEAKEEPKQEKPEKSEY